MTATSLPSGVLVRATSVGLATVATFATLASANVALAAGCPDPSPGPYPAYVGARPRTAACSASEIDLFTKSLLAGELSAVELEGVVREKSRECASCLFSHLEDPAWSYMVLTGDPKSPGFRNRGACYERAPGGSFACGDATFSTVACVERRCSTCSSDALMLDCYNGAVTDLTQCGKWNDNPACGGLKNYEKLDVACGDVASAATILCGSTAPESRSAPPGAETATDEDALADAAADAARPAGADDDVEPAPAPSASVDSGCAHARGSTTGATLGAFVMLVALGIAAIRSRRSVAP